MGKVLGYRTRRMVHDYSWELLILPNVVSPEVPLLPGLEYVLLPPVWFARLICPFSILLVTPAVSFFQVRVTLVGLMVTASVGLGSILILFPKKRKEKNYISKRNVRVRTALYVYFPEVNFATTEFHFSLFASWTSLQQNTFRFPYIHVCMCVSETEGYKTKIKITEGGLVGHDLNMELNLYRSWHKRDLRCKISLSPDSQKTLLMERHVQCRSMW